MTPYGGLANGAHEILDPMDELKLLDMNAALDEVIANGIKRRHEPQLIMGDQLAVELAEKLPAMPQDFLLER
jgi:hypothetical protein